MENHLGELWALFSVLVPGLLGSEEGFRKIFRRPIEREDDLERAHALARRLAPFMLRRTKAAVAPELPPRTEIVHTVGMEDGQGAIYERVRADMNERLRRVLLRGLSKTRESKSLVPCFGYGRFVVTQGLSKKAEKSILRPSSTL